MAATERRGPVDRYREPLAAAAFDLRGRCWNIVKNNFLGRFGREHDRFPDAQMTTLFRFAQYFGWAEILRRESSARSASGGMVVTCLRLRDRQHDRG